MKFNFINSCCNIIFNAQHTDPDYSCAYVTIKTNKGIEGYGLTFTLGRGTEIGTDIYLLYKITIYERYYQNFL